MLNKKSKILLFSLIAIIGLLTFLEANEPKPINWFPSYAKTDKIPLGTFVSYEVIKDAYESSTIRDVNQPPYEFLTSQDSSFSGTYLFVNNTISFDDSELSKLLSWIDEGNTLFVSAKSISSNLLDTLNLETNTLVAIDDMSTKPLLELTNNHLRLEQPFLYDRDIKNVYFSEIDTVRSTVLGRVSLYNDTLELKKPKINYIKYSHGKGKILLHTFPEAFGNYFMLKDDNNTYTQNLLSYIESDTPILWDNYYKTGKVFYTPLYLFLSKKSLKWAYYLVLIGTVLFVFFEGKRKQRSIPIITPLKNQTIAFTRTISGMYFEKQKHKEIATKQNLLFLEYIRNTLRIPTHVLNEKTVSDIAARSNNSLEDTKELFKLFDTIDKKPSISKEELIQLHAKISKFKKKV